MIVNGARNPILRGRIDMNKKQTKEYSRGVPETHEDS
jgi:hypothetical protein